MSSSENIHLEFDGLLSVKRYWGCAALPVVCLADRRS